MRIDRMRCDKTGNVRKKNREVHMRTETGVR